MQQEFLFGDSLDGLRGLPSQSVNLVSTSPPWGTLRTYGGHTFNREKFEAIARQLWRVVVDGGIVAWHVGDQMPNGSLTDEPMYQLLFFRHCGFFHYQTLITQVIGERGNARHYVNPPQYVWVMSKGRPTTVNLLTRPNLCAGGTAGIAYRYADGTRIEKDRVEVKTHGVRSSIWLYPVYGHTEKPYSGPGVHGATQHQKLAQDLIHSYSRPLDLVVDPFGGLGTTAKWAILQGRQALSWEIHRPYYALGLKRVEQAKRDRIRSLLS